MADYVDSEYRLERELLSATAALVHVFQMLPRQARAKIKVGSIRRLLLTGGSFEVARRYGILADAALEAAQQRALIAGNAQLAALGRELRRSVRTLDLSRPRFAARLAAQRREIVTALIDAQARAIETALRESKERQRDPARTVWYTLGLSAQQVSAVIRYEAVLQAAARGRPVALPRDIAERIQEDADLDEGISGETAVRMSQAYRNGLANSAAGVTALLVAQEAVGIGQDEAAQQALEDGALEDVSWEWITARDERVRNSHRAMHGQLRADGEPFLSGNGNLLRYPGDPAAPISDRIGCRCVRRMRATAPAPSPLS